MGWTDRWVGRCKGVATGQWESCTIHVLASRTRAWWQAWECRQGTCGDGGHTAVPQHRAVQYPQYGVEKPVCRRLVIRSTEWSTGWRSVVSSRVSGLLQQASATRMPTGGEPMAPDARDRNMWCFTRCDTATQMQKHSGGRLAHLDLLHRAL